MVAGGLMSTRFARLCSPSTGACCLKSALGDDVEDCILLNLPKSERNLVGIKDAVLMLAVLPSLLAEKAAVLMLLGRWLLGRCCWMRSNCCCCLGRPLISASTSFSDCWLLAGWLELLGLSCAGIVVLRPVSSDCLC